MKIPAGSTDVSLFVYFVDDVGGTNPGEPTTGLLFSDIETGGSASYARQGAARVDLELITLASASAAHADGGFILLDNTSMPGVYRVDYPDAAFVVGVEMAVIQLVAASAKNTIMRPLWIDLETVQADLDNATDGLGALKALIDAIPTTAMRGTDNALLAASINLTGGAVDTVTTLTGKQGFNAMVDTTVATVNSQTDFDLTAGSGDDDAYNDAVVVFEDADGDQSFRRVTNYTAASNNIVIDAAPDFTVVATDPVRIYPAAVTPTAAVIADAIWDEATADHITVGTFGQRLSTLESGTAVAATASTITLDAGSSELADFYNDTLIVITAGTGAGQARFISDYAVTTNVATVNSNWITTPSTDSVYYIIPFGSIPGASAPTAAQVADAVHDEALADHQIQGSAGAAVTMTAYLGPQGPGVYLDDGVANTGTTLGDDGTREKPVSTIAAATTIASGLGVQLIYLVNDTVTTLAQTYEGWVFVGLGLSNKITLGSQDVDNSEFCNLILTGTQGGTGQLYAHHCSLTALVSAELIAMSCWLTGNNTLRAATTHIFKDCCSAVAGDATPDLTFPGSGTTEVNFRHYSGGLTVKSGTTNDTISFEGNGQLIVDASCTSLTVRPRGNFKLTDNGTTTDIELEAVPNLTNIKAEFDTALADINLDHFMKVAVTDSDVVDDSALAKLADAGATADWSNYRNEEDSQRAISEKVGAIGTVTGSGFPYAVDGDNTLRDTIDNAAAVDKGGGLVGIPVTGHGFVAGKEITIAGSTNYNNAYAIVSQTTNEVVITETYAAETFGGSETIVSSIEGVVFVGTQTLTFAATEAEDGATHDILHDNNVIDIVYSISIDGGQRATDIELKGFVNSANDNILVQAFDFAGSDWETRGTLVGQGGSSNKTVAVKALAKHTGTGANLGQIYVRLITEAGSSSPTLKTDELFVDASGIGQSVGYALGRIWANTLSGVAGTVPFTHGVGDNPSLLWADVLTLSASVGLTDFHIINGSTIQLTGNSDNFSLFGNNWTLDLNGQSVDGAHFEGATVSGTFTGTPEFDDCTIGSITGPSADLHDCGLDGTITANAAGSWVAHHCYSAIAGATTPIFDYGTDAAVNSNVTLGDYRNGIEFRNLNNAGTDLLSLSGTGQVIYAASCSGTVNQRGEWKVTNTGGVTITEDDNTANIAGILADTDNIQTRLPAALVGGAMDSNVSALQANVITAAVIAAAALNGKGDWNIGKTGYALSAAGVDAILDETYEGTTTFRQFLRLAAAPLFGILAGAATTTVTIRDEADSKDRITATVDSSGNRTAVTLDKTA
jgi:hypothetical protein